MAAHTYIPSVAGVDKNDTVDYLPVEEITAEHDDLPAEHITEEPNEQSDAHSVTKHHYETAVEADVTADGTDSLGGQDEILIFSLEGMTEAVPAKRVSGEGYSLLIPKEGWRSRLKTMAGTFAGGDL